MQNNQNDHLKMETKDFALIMNQTSCHKHVMKTFLGQSLWKKKNGFKVSKKQNQLENTIKDALISAASIEC